MSSDVAGVLILTCFLILAVPGPSLAKLHPHLARVGIDGSLNTLTINFQKKYTVVLSEETRCPYNAPQRALQCLGDLDKNTGAGDKAWDYARIYRACRDGTFRSAVSCAADVVKRCKKHKSQNEILTRYLDIPTMMRGVNSLCSTDLPDLKLHSGCIQRQRGVVQLCAELALARYYAEHRSHKDSIDRMMQVSCSLVNKVYGCQEEAVLENCGHQAAQKIRLVLNYFKPASCKTRNIAGVRSGTRNTNTYLDFFTKVFIILCYLCFANITR